MPDARYRPPQAAPDFALTDAQAASRARRVARIVGAVALVPILVGAYEWAVTSLHWVLVTTFLDTLAGTGREHAWRNGACYAIAFGAADLAIALVAYRPLAWVYGRWATVAACLVVAPYAATRVAVAASQVHLVGSVVHWAHVLTATLPLVLLTEWRRRAVARQASAAGAPGGAVDPGPDTPSGSSR